jgi:hypothetical protein
LYPNREDRKTHFVRTKHGKYYLCLPLPLSKTPENQGHKEEDEAKKEERHVVASIDPGVRTFATVYDPQGKAADWGRFDIGRIYRLWKPTLARPVDVAARFTTHSVGTKSSSAPLATSTAIEITTELATFSSAFSQQQLHPLHHLPHLSVRWIPQQRVEAFLLSRQ